MNNNEELKENELVSPDQEIVNDSEKTSTETPEQTNTTTIKKKEKPKKSIKRQQGQKAKKEKTPKKSKNEPLNEQTDSKRLNQEKKSIDKHIKAAQTLLDFGFFVIFILTTLMLIFTASTAKHNNIPSFVNTNMVKSTHEFNEELVKVGVSTNSSLEDIKYIQFVTKKSYPKETVIAYFKDSINENSKVVRKFHVDKITGTENGKYIVSSGQKVDPSTIVGQYAKLLKASWLIDLLMDPFVYLYLTLFPLLFLSLIGAFMYFILYPKRIKIKSLSKKLDSISDTSTANESKSSSKITGDYLEQSINHIKNMKQNDIIPMPLPSGVDEILNENYYTTVTASGDKVYQLIRKFPEYVAFLEELGATDMDIIKVNMVGCTEFDDLLVSTKKENTDWDLNEIIKYLNKLPNVHCIKKSGVMNWTFKYLTKTFAIIRADAKNGYKISFKLYPDATYKLNVLFMALEDSNFPSGPYWYMVNNLRNLPMSVLKWILFESYRISKMQQVKASFVRTDKHLSTFVDTQQLKTNIELYTPITKFEKFDVVVRNLENVSPSSTILDDGWENLNVEDYTKEIYFDINNNFGVSILLKKKATEAIATAISYDIHSILKDEVQENKSITSVSKNKEKQSTVTIKKTAKKR